MNLQSAIEKTISALCAANTEGTNTDNLQETDYQVRLNHAGVTFSVVCRNGEGGVYACGDLGGEFVIESPLRELIEKNVNFSANDWAYIPM